MMSRFAFVALASLALAACTPMPQHEMATAPQPQSAFVTGAQLDPATHPVLYDALRQLRPAMLRTRGGSDTIVVEIEGTAVGGVGELRTIRTRDVRSVERLSGLRQRGGQTVLQVRLRT